MNRSQFLREVGDTLTKREHTYGHPSNNLRAIAKTWSEYKGQDFNYLDVCIMMILTKAMRLKTKPDGAKLFAMIAKFLFLKMKIPNDRKAMNENIPKEIHAAGTWTYIILTASLWI